MENRNHFDEDEKESIIWNFNFIKRKMIPEILSSVKSTIKLSPDDDEFEHGIYFTQILVNEFSDTVYDMIRTLFHENHNRKLVKPIKAIDSGWVKRMPVLEELVKNLSNDIDAQKIENLLNDFMKDLTSNLSLIFPDQIKPEEETARNRIDDRIMITISEQDLNTVLKTAMTIDEMDNTVKGRIYMSIVRAYKNEHPDEFGVIQEITQ